MFNDCQKLKEVSLPNGLKTINTRLFSMCDSLMKVTIPEGVTTIEDLAFSHSNIIEVELPSTLESIGADVFTNTPMLKKLVYNGTKTEWEQVTKSLVWCTVTHKITIKCTDKSLEMIPIL